MTLHQSWRAAENGSVLIRGIPSETPRQVFQQP